MVQRPPSRDMDTTVDLEVLAVLRGPDPAFLVQNGRPVVIIGDPNARDAHLRLSNAITRLTSQRVRDQGPAIVIMHHTGRKRRLHGW
jgi:hypothetical protein